MVAAPNLGKLFRPANIETMSAKKFIAATMDQASRLAEPFKNGLKSGLKKAEIAKAGVELATATSVATQNLTTKDGAKISAIYYGINTKNQIELFAVVGKLGFPLKDVVSKSSDSAELGKAIATANDKAITAFETFKTKGSETDKLFRKLDLKTLSEKDMTQEALSQGQRELNPLRDTFKGKGKKARAEGDEALFNATAVVTNKLLSKGGDEIAQVHLGVTKGGKVDLFGVVNGKSKQLSKVLSAGESPSDAVQRAVSAAVNKGFRAVDSFTGK